MEEEKEWAFNLDAFLSAESLFPGGKEHLEKIFYQALENDQTLAAQVNEALQAVRLRDPRNRKEQNPADPMTPGEIFLNDHSLKLLVRCAEAVQKELMKTRGGPEAGKGLNLIDEILRNVRLRARKFKKNRREDRSP